MDRESYLRFTPLIVCSSFFLLFCYLQEGGKDDFRPLSLSRLARWGRTISTPFFPSRSKGERVISVLSIPHVKGSGDGRRFPLSTSLSPLSASSAARSGKAHIVPPGEGKVGTWDRGFRGLAGTLRTRLRLQK